MDSRSSLDSLLDKLHLEILNEAKEETISNEVITVQSVSNSQETRLSSDDIDKEISDLENLIKKLQAEINDMTENVNKPKEHSSKTNLETINETAVYSLNNFSQNPGPHSIGVVECNFENSNDDLNSKTASELSDLSLIKELKEKLKDGVVDAQIDVTSAGNISNVHSDDLNTHVLKDYMAKKKNAEPPELVQVVNTLNFSESATEINESVPQSNDNTGSSTVRLGILMRIFGDDSKSTNKKIDNIANKINKSKESVVILNNDEPIVTTTKDINNVENKIKHSLLDAQDVIQNEINIKSGNVETSHSITTTEKFAKIAGNNLHKNNMNSSDISNKNEEIIIKQSSHNLKGEHFKDEIYEKSKAQVNIPRRMSIINIYIDAPNSATNNLQRSKTQSSAISKENINMKGKATTVDSQITSNNSNITIESSTCIDDDIDEPANKSIMKSETMEIPNAVKEAYCKEASVINASVKLNPSLHIKSNAQLLDNDLSKQINNNLSRPNKASLNETDAIRITINEAMKNDDNNKISSAETGQQDFAKDATVEDGGNPIDMFKKPEEDNNTLVSNNVTKLSQENDKKEPKEENVPDETTPVVAENNTSSENQEEKSALIEESVSENTAAVPMAPEKETPANLEQQEAAPCPRRVENTFAKPVANETFTATVTTIDTDNINSSTLNEIENKAVESPIPKVADNVEASSKAIVEDANQSSATKTDSEVNVNIGNDDLTDEFESLDGDNESFKGERFLNDRTVYINKTDIIINNGDNFSDVYEDSQDFTSERTSRQSKKN